MQTDADFDGLDPIDAALLRCTPRAALSVIEIGGSSAQLQRVFRRFVPDVTWNPARGRADAVIVRAETHVDPPRLIREAAAALGAGGTLLAVVPVRSRPRGEGRAITEAFAALGFPQLDVRQVAGDRPSIHSVLRGRRAAQGRLSILNAVPVMLGGGNAVRIEEPASFLATLPGVETRTVNFKRTFPMPAGTDRILVMQRARLHRERSLESLRAARAAGYVTVMEMDDHPDFQSGYRENDYINFRGVHAVQVSTPTLRQVLSDHNTNLAVFENQVAELPPLPSRQGGGDVTLIFAAINRQGAWPPYIEALNRVLAARSRLRVVVFHDNAFHDALGTDRKAFFALQDYASYRRALNAADIVFMPLADTLFNRCKSDLKFLDAAVTGAVALASPTVYGRTIRDGATGVLFDSPESLEQRLIALVDDDRRRHAIAQAAHDYVRRERMLAQHVETRLTWYRSLIRDIDRLDRELAARVPALGRRG